MEISDEVAEALRRITELTQGQLPRLVLSVGSAQDEERWRALEPHLPDLSGRRVLDLGSRAGHDSLRFRARGAREVFACQPHAETAPVRSLDGDGVRLEQIGWRELDPEAHGTYDLVHCNGMLAQEPDPLGMLQRLRQMLAGGGELLLGAAMLADAELAEYVRYVRSEPAGGWIPGRLAVRWMLDTSGFQTSVVPIWLSGPAPDPDIGYGYIRGRLAGSESG